MLHPCPQGHLDLLSPGPRPRFPEPQCPQSPVFPCPRVPVSPVAWLMSRGQGHGDRDTGWGAGAVPSWREVALLCSAGILGAAEELLLCQNP